MAQNMFEVLAGNYGLFSGTTERYLRLLTNEDLDWKPREDMRTVRDIVVHLYDGVELICNCIKSGKIERSDEEAITKRLEAMTVEEIIAYQKQIRRLYVDTMSKAKWEELETVIHVFYGDFPYAQMLGFVYDEHLHHRGQLSIYLRLMGKEVPFAYDYEHNEAF